ncbi:HMG box-containing protein [Nannizzia gypsea CBS 118893]|uniref:HMG box-containing protein n=1 Tax=Arthroderma gypseum (strain ATCC MYA-4604 / CBS 118893) TaxID=535722 RepID=E5QZJ9_ARTGP|nr:HMG box-containing protein [Nannizzia gypsea CBS 118893]EFQ97365.1 HMG box-containing protein [Nannizzia gypsea CBS 118893]
MARLYTKPRENSQVAKTSIQDKEKNVIEDKSIIKSQSTTRDDEVEENTPSRSSGRANRNETKDDARRASRSRRRIDGQEKLISQLSDLSLTSKKREEVCRGEDEEEDVVKRFTKLELQEADEDIEEELAKEEAHDEEEAQADKRSHTHIFKKKHSYSHGKEEGEEEESTMEQEEYDTDGFDSLDDFIVSDNESLSLYEDLEYEGEDDSDAEEKERQSSKTHTSSNNHLDSEAEAEPEPKSESEPEAQHRPRRRLIRGRRKQRSSTPSHTSDNETCESVGKPNNTPGLDEDPLLFTNMGNNISCPVDQEANEQDAAITTDVLLDSRPRLPPPASPKYSKEHKKKNKPSVGLTSTKNTNSRATGSPQGLPLLSSPESPGQDSSKMSFVTPPTSPTKPRLKSPSKSQANRIPPSPHKPDIDMFWDQKTVNEWNDKFSPQKIKAPNFYKRHFDIFSDTEDEADDDEQIFGSQDNDFVITGVSIPGHLGTPEPDAMGDKLPLHASPIKNNASPGKKQAKASASTKKALAAKKREFDQIKHALATNFFNELDTMVTGGEILKLAESAGGVNIVWNNKLATTAGGATWKKELITRNRDSTEQFLIDSSSANLCSPNNSSSHAPSSTSSSATSALPTDELLISSSRSSVHRSIRHNATIELAEKVIDCEDRLLNTLAHEYCHLANFMISGVLNQPHGASFKQWAKKCMTALDAHSEYSGKVEVSTKHSYLINYKYMWCCMSCGQEYGRHSRSIDPVKVRCGKCHDGKLLQVKPKPRGKSKV